MSSVPTSSHLASSPTPQQGMHRVHRHRRSAAISGDFDAIGLGLFSPPPPISKASRHSSLSASPQHNSQHSELHQRLYLSSFVSRLDQSSFNTMDDVELNRHFQFSNEDDFSNKPQLEGFQFPSNSPDLSLLSLPSTPRYLMSPIRKFSGPGSNLNSPIRLRSKKMNSLVYSPLLSLTEKTTTIDDKNIPGAVIDLDDILNANMLNTDNNEGDVEISDRIQDDFLASPFTKPGPFYFLGSSLSSSYIKQLIHELAPDSIEEEDLDEFRLAEEEIIDQQSEDTAVLDENDLLGLQAGAYENPQNSFNAVYLTLSANSSNSSLPSSGGCTGQRFPFISLIEKISSNSSKDSGASTFFSNTGTPAKRSSAKASRYQSFYDQTYKISSALKYSSTESIHLVGNENVQSISLDSLKGDRSLVPKVLGHSSSLPTLKSNVKRPASARYAETRAKRDFKSFKPGIPLGKSIHSHDHIAKHVTSGQKPLGNVLLSPSKVHHHTMSDSQYMGRQKNIILVSSQSKNLSNSPSSLLSEYSSTVTFAGDAYTDYSSVISHGDVTMTGGKSIPSESSRSSTPVIVISSESEVSLDASKTPNKLPHISQQSDYSDDVRSGCKDLSNYSRRPKSPHEKKVIPGVEGSHLKTAEKDKRVQRVPDNHRDSVGADLKPLIEDTSKCDSTRKVVPGFLQKHARRRSDRFSMWFRKGKG